MEKHLIQAGDLVWVSEVLVVLLQQAEEPGVSLVQAEV
jgi:hypothetical protein